MITKSESRQILEKSIMDKIQGIFDSAENIQRFHIEIVGAYDRLTSIKYSVEENIIPRKDDDNEPLDS